MYICVRRIDCVCLYQARRVKCHVYMCETYRLYLFLRLSDWAFELFQRCGIFLNCITKYTFPSSDVNRHTFSSLHLGMLGLWYLTPFSIIMHLYQFYRWRKPEYPEKTTDKSLTNFITYCYIEYSSPERNSNSQRY